MAARSMLKVVAKTGAILAVALLAFGCASISVSDAPDRPKAELISMPAAEKAKFEQDRKAILAMAGDFDVTFDFRETVSLTPGYELKKPKLSGADEIVRVVEDRGNFISLQQILVMKVGDEMYVTKHWRQDWKYEPAEVLVFIGGNAWERRAVSQKDRAGKWSQVVYQVEDSPRYGAVGAWTHDHGVSQWSPPAEMRPLPRRDMTTRTDYDAVLAVNRHTITPFGWVQEEENSKLVLRGDHHVLVREIGVNSYKRTNTIPKDGDDYWNATKDFWALVRADWNRLEQSTRGFGLTIQGEPEPLYTPILELADNIQAGKTTTAAAAGEARKVIAQFTTTDIGALSDRIAKSVKIADAAAPAASR
ncbi:MAG: hypothetical protein Q8R02_24620 [Hyphomonadaceae bacterium]|nr:hypothetical protein [Hyphomonadaceae bacterium]